MGEQLAAGHEMTVAILSPKALQLTVTGDKSIGSDNGCYVNHKRATARAGACFELAVPLDDLGAAPGDLLSFVITVARHAAPADAAPVAVERIPARQPIDLVVPAAGFDAAHWRA
jgi:hypothetical protein